MNTHSTHTAQVQHTPGPYQAYLGNHRWCVETAAFPARLVAIAYNGADQPSDPSLDGEQAANARLIAAAPELLAIAEGLAAWEADPDRFGGDLAELAQQARAAIAKARGQ